MEEQKKLIEDITAQLPKIDRASCFRRIKKINWEKVSIENRTEKECKEHLDKMIKKIRHQRNLNEVLCDVIVNLEKKPSLTVKPQSAYTLYCKHLILQKPDMKGKNFFQEASNNFKKLSDAEKAVFERESTKQRELYLLEKKKLTEAKMDELTPTPFVLFCKYHMALGSSSKYTLIYNIIFLNISCWNLKNLRTILYQVLFKEMHYLTVNNSKLQKEYSLSFLILND